MEAWASTSSRGSGFSKNAPSDTIEILLGEGAKSGFRNPRSSRWDSEAPDIDWLNAKYTVVLSDYTDTDDQGNPKEYEFKARVVGIVEDDNAGHGYNMYCSLDTMKLIMQKNKKVFQNISMKTDEYPSAVVKVDSFENVLDVQDQIKSMGLSSYSMAETIQQMQESSKSLQLMLGGIGGVAMLVAAISICNTMLMSIYEAHARDRRHEGARLQDEQDRRDVPDRGRHHRPGRRHPGALRSATA